MAEIIKLTTPLPASADFRIADVDFNIRGSLISVIYAEWLNGDWVPDGRQINIYWTGAQADALINAVNKTNNTIKSLATRINEQAIADGKITATPSGAPI